MSADANREFAALASERTGHLVRSHGSTRLDVVIERGMARCGVRTGAEFHDVLKADSRVLEDLVAEMAVKETYFFRVPEQFRHIRDYLSRALVPSRLVGGIRSGVRPQLRVWSVGCATGEEAYSVAAVVASVLKHPHAWDLEILASDISQTALDHAAAGQYPHPRVAAKADDLLGFLRRHVSDMADGGWVVDDDLKSMITFMRHNILTCPLPAAPFDIVLCRNLMVYMPIESQRRLIDRLWECVRPGGLLFMGDAELLHIMQHRFEPVWLPNAVAYRRPAAHGDTAGG